MSELAARTIINLCGVLIVGYMSQHNDHFREGRRRAYLYVAVAVALSLVAEAFSIVFTEPTSLHRSINLITCLIGFGLSPVIPLLLVNAFRDEGYRLNRALMFPFVVNLILVFFSPAYGFIFEISASNEYARGWLFPFYVLAYLFGMFVFVIAAFKAMSIYQSRSRIVLIALVCLTLFGTTVQLLWSGMLVSWSTITIVMILGYVNHSELLDQYDVMTRLFNRRAYETHLLEVERYGRGVVVLFDLDDYKLVNDSFGHQYGDECLRTLADIIRSSYSKIGCSYRIGGDEFSVLGKCDRANVIEKANSDFLRNVDEARRKDPRLPWVSLGYALYDSSQRIDQVVAEADRQLFAYKRERKGDNRL